MDEIKWLNEFTDSCQVLRLKVDRWINHHPFSCTCNTCIDCKELLDKLKVLHTVKWDQPPVMDITDITF